MRQEIFHVPFWRPLVLPRPENPAGMTLVRIKLRFDERADVVSVVRRQLVHGARVLSVAGANIRAASQGTVVPRPFATAIQPFRAVGLSASPFAYDSPLVRASEPAAEAAGRLDVLARALGDFALVEDLVLMGVEDDVTAAKTQESVPEALYVFKGVVDDNDDIIATVADSLPAVIVKLFDSVSVEGRAEGLIEEFNAADYVCLRSVAPCELSHGIQGVLDIIARLPLNRA